MLHKKLFGIIRGKATPVQVFLACLLGALIGFQPGFAEAPLVLGALVGLLVVLNANLFVAALVGAGSFLLSLVTLGLQFEIGMAVIDGPLRPVFAWAVNAPVLAWAGLSNYVAVGALVMGVVVGGGLGVLAVVGLLRMRRLMARFEEDSKLFARLSANKPFKLVAWLLLGGLKAKKGSYADLANKVVGRPVRITGVILVVLSVGLGVMLVMLLESPMTVRALTSGLTRANGATVEIDSAEVDVASGRIALIGFAMVDAEDLMRNVVEADRVELDLSGADLLSKRFALSSVVVREARYDAKRLTPGRLYKKKEDTRDVVPPIEEDRAPEEDEPRDLSDYVADVEQWRDRLAQAKRWLEKLGGDDESVDDAGTRPTRDELLTDKQSLRDYLQQQARELGYSKVYANHLVSGSPAVRIDELRVEGLTTERAPGETFDVEGRSLSSHPSLLETPAVLSVSTRSGRYSARAQGGGPIEASATGFSMDEISEALKTGDFMDVIRGGTVDLSLDGVLAGGGVRGDIVAMIRGATLSIPEIGDRVLGEIPVTIGVSGPVDRPRLRVDAKALRTAAEDALKDAAVNEGLDRLDEELDKAVGDKLDGVIDEDTRKKARDAIRGLFRGGDGD